MRENFCEKVKVRSVTPISAVIDCSFGVWYCRISSSTLARSVAFICRQSTSKRESVLSRYSG